jgi:hypothetical protein
MLTLQRLTMLAALLVASASAAKAQSDNLLQNPNADLEAQSWRTTGRAAVEEFGGDRCFVVRNGGSFYQDVALPKDAAGQYVVFVGRGSSERASPDGIITDQPYLYGYMLGEVEGRRERVLDYLQGMLGVSTFANEWVRMSGVFRVPERASRIRFFLNQGLRLGVDRDGSAARFDDLGLYMFPTEEEAGEFSRRWRLGF